MSSHARSTRRKSNTAVEQIETDWKHAAVRPAPHVELPEWLLEETDKVAHRDYSTGFYYPEHKVTQNTDRSAYFRSMAGSGRSAELERGRRRTCHADEP